MKLLWHQLEFPDQLEVEQLLQFIRSLATRARHGLLMSADPVAVEIEASNGQLHWRFGVAPREAEQVLGHLYACLPNVRCEPTTNDRQPFTTAWELRTSNPRRPLRTDVATEVVTGLLVALQAAGDHEAVCLQWLIGGWLTRPVVPTTRVQPTTGAVLTGSAGLMLTTEQAAALREKQRESLLQAIGRIGVSAATTARRRQLRQGVVGALQLLRTPGVGVERRLMPSGMVAKRMQRCFSPTIAWPCVFSASELTAALGWPVGNPLLAGVSYPSGRQLPATPASLVAAGTAEGRRITGRVSFPGQSGLVGQAPRDSLMHTWVLGPTGSGKSWLLASMALSDIAAGRGVVVIDAKGDLTKDIANRIPAERLDDVVLFEPDAERPIGFNPLAGSTPEAAVDSIVHTLHEMYTQFWGPRTASIFTNGLMTLATHGGLTLAELPPLLTNPTFQAKVLTKVGHDELGVAPFWQWYADLRPSEKAAAVGPVLNKMEAFTGRRRIRRIVGQVQGFDLGSVLRDGKVLLVNLGQGAIGSENAYLLGSLLLGQLYDHIQARSRIRPSERRPVAIYLDEFQQILRLPVGMADALATARGLGVGFTLAHQELGQLSSTVRSAVAANCRSRIFFQLGHDDAVVAAKLLGHGLTASDLEHLRAYETYQALAQGGVTSRPVSVATLPLPPSLDNLPPIRRRSAERYGQGGEAVDAELRARRQVALPTPNMAVGSRRRGSRP
ncbi:MAG TPA: TraM recognition domain-containing protein [Acidimicrobiales bacterium]|nr:TraM recognition domain-containing protein [Acidimicrobiales bacterium]